MMTASQVGKTEIILNLIGYFSHWEPASILILQPTVELAEDFSKDRLANMIRDSPELREVYPDPKSRNQGNTILHKTFPGGYARMVGSNAPSALAMRPVRVLLADECDRYPPSAGTEGDPLYLASVRQTTYWNRKRFECSSPTIKGTSRIARRYEQSSQERYEVPCPDCGHAQPLAWSGVVWADGDPSTAAYQCSACDALWTEAQKIRAIGEGQWVAAHPERRTHRGFHLSALYSPWVSMATLVAAYLDAKDDPLALQVFTNTSLGELWEGEGETVDAEVLHDNRKQPIETVPKAADVVTAGVDVQADRLEYEIVAWRSSTRESWSLEYDTIDGDPRIAYGTAGSPWTVLEERLSSDLQVEGGGAVSVRAVFIDAGYLFDEVTAFCRRRGRRGWYASRGEGGQGKAWIIGSSRNNRHRARVFRLGVDAIKGAIYRLLQVPDPGDAGYCAFPEEYQIGHFEQLTAEHAVTRRRGGFPQLVWELPPGRRNEVLDCRVYALAALERVKPRRTAILRPTTGPRRTQPAEQEDDFFRLGAIGEDFIRGP